MNTKLPRGAQAALLFYNAFFPFVLAAMLPGLLARMLRRGNFRRNFGQRFGRYTPAVRARLAAHAWTWMHSISVGETFLALQLARKMKELDPALHVVLSATTSTGFALAEAHAADWIEVIYNPLDALPFVRRALDAVRPTRLIFIEAIWPNLLAQAKLRSVPIGMVPRLSPRSERRFLKVRRLVRPIFALIDAMAVPDPTDAPRWEALGVAPERMRVTGNMKFDHTPASPARVEEFRALLRKLGVGEGSPVLLGGSTFPGEERLLGEAFLELRVHHPGLFLIVVPRHIERTHEVAADLTALGLTFALRTGGGGRPADCLIVNTTGELRDWYHLSTVVFMGKSLCAIGGQNPMEAVAAGKPVVFGPHMENFQPLVSQWLAADAAVEVPDATALSAAIGKLLHDPLRRETLATRALQIAAPHQGATGRVAKFLSQAPHDAPAP